MTLIDRIRAHHKIPDADPVGVKFCLTGKQRVDETSRIVTAVANTADIDLADEVVVPEGAVRDAANRPMYISRSRSIYLNHNYDILPIGKMRNMKLSKDGWVCQFQILDVSQIARETFLLIQEGAINGVSIGFKSLNWGPLSPDEVERYGPASGIIRSWLWIELSVTPQPCNPEAWITMVEKSAAMPPPDETIRQVEGMMRKGHISRATAAAIGMPEPKPMLRKIILT